MNRLSFLSVLVLFAFLSNPNLAFAGKEKHANKPATVQGSKQAGYNFSLRTGTYSNLTGATVLDTTANWDDPEFLVALGFGFNYFGFNFDSIWITDYAYFPDTGFDNYIDAFYADFVSRDSLGGNSSISYKTEGSPGSRILKVEWKDAGFFCELDSVGTTNSYTNVQLWLYEGSNIIEMHVGPNMINNAGVAYCGNNGPAFGIWNGMGSTDEYYYLVGDPNNPSVSSLGDTLLNGTPSNGTIYRFTPDGSVGIADKRQSTLELNLFPNPVQDVLNIASPRPLTGTVALEVLDVQGKILFREAFHNGFQNADIITTDLQPGVYFIQLHHEEGMSYRKFLKE